MRNFGPNKVLMTPFLCRRVFLIGRITHPDREEVDRDLDRMGTEGCMEFMSVFDHLVCSYTTISTVFRKARTFAIIMQHETIIEYDPEK
jgi:hypothetical protein